VDAKAQFRSLPEPWTDTGTRTGRLMIAVPGGLADVERDLIRTRTAEGRNRAQKRGQHMGRPSKLTDAQKAEARRRRAEVATLAELARSYHVGKSTISRLTECATLPCMDLSQKLVSIPFLGANDRGSDPAIRAAGNHRDRASARNKRRGKV
jgi:hypothetical protein